MSYSSRLKAAQKFVNNRDNEEQRKLDKIREKCDKALTVVHGYSNDIKEIIELYNYCVTHNIPLRNANNYLFDNGSPSSGNYGFSLNLGSFYGVDVLVFNKNCVRLIANRSGVIVRPYENNSSYAALLNCYAALTAFADLFPSFKLSFYTAFDKAVGYEEKKSREKKGDSL